MMHHVARPWLALSLSLVFCGCGGDSGEGGKKVPVYTVTGKVTMSGGPLVGAVVSFAPKEGQPVAVGTTNEAGVYTLSTYASGDGAAAGNYSVVVTKASAPTGASSPDAGHGSAETKGGHAESGSGGAAAATNLVPQQYGDSTKTPLSAKVESKPDNQFDFEIK